MEEHMSGLGGSGPGRNQGPGGPGGATGDPAGPTGRPTARPMDGPGAEEATAAGAGLPQSGPTGTPEES